MRQSRSMQAKLTQALTDLFEKHRHVFWYDPEGEYTEPYAQLELPGVERIEVGNDEFRVKYRLLCEQPAQKFLLYFPRAEPPAAENWLLDLQLDASGRVFHTERAALHLQDLGLDLGLRDVVRTHEAFFGNQQRVKRLQGYLTGRETADELRRRMVRAVLQAGREDNESLLQHYAVKYPDEHETIDRQLRTYGLFDWFWADVAKHYAYTTDEPGIADFLLDQFGRHLPSEAERRYAATHRNTLGAGDNQVAAERAGRYAVRTSASTVFFSDWQNSSSTQADYRRLSNWAFENLNGDQWAQSAPLEALQADWLFAPVDIYLLRRLAGRILNDTMSVAELEATHQARRQSFWYEAANPDQNIQTETALREGGGFRAYYEALDHAVRLFDLTRRAALPNGLADSAEALLADYTTTWYAADLHYRQFCFQFNFRLAQATLLAAINGLVQRRYTYAYLEPLNRHFGALTEAHGTWFNGTERAQRQFFRRFVQPFVDKKLRVFVIISDALRYENAQELLARIRTTNRYVAELDYQVSGLPSYTQLGMAALLPHDQLTVDDKHYVYADGHPTQGTDSRTRVLQRRLGERSVAIRADQLLAMPAAKEGRQFTKAHDVIYVYSNTIDATGDTASTEQKTFQAVATELDRLEQLIRYVLKVNAYRILITADHGYLYREELPTEAEYVQQPPTGELKGKVDRRFALGTELQADTDWQHFDAAAVGLTDATEVLTVRGVRRAGNRGQGSRYVHGGASLQETVLPVLRVEYRRQDLAREVKVSLIKTAGNKITSNLLVIELLQAEPVVGKVQPITLRVGLYAGDNTLISNQEELTFDRTDEAIGGRVQRVSLTLQPGAADRYRNQEVELRLQQPTAKTSYARLYHVERYRLSVSFSGDFDF